jgi:hypothetical protein
MITNAPSWLQPFLWIAFIALAGWVIVLLWIKLSPIIERRHVESMSAPPRNWRHDVLSGSILLLVFAIALILILIA